MTPGLDRMVMDYPVRIRVAPPGRQGNAKHYDPHQARDLSGLTDVEQVEGSFGDLAMGVNGDGDVRLAFRDHQIDLGIDEVAELGDTVERLTASRDDLPDDAEYDGVYDDERWGAGQHHKAELFGGGSIGVTFDADSDDPWTLLLDPPYEADPDDPEDEDVDDAQLLLDAIDHIFDSSAAAEAQTEAVA